MVTYERRNITQSIIIKTWCIGRATKFFQERKPDAIIYGTSELDAIGNGMILPPGMPVLEVPEDWISVDEEIRTLESDINDIEEIDGFKDGTNQDVNGKYFYGNEISSYGQREGYVDYYTLSKAFNSVLNNEIYQVGQEIGDGWEPISGYSVGDGYERLITIIEDIETQQQTIEELRELNLTDDQLKKLNDLSDILNDKLEDAQDKLDDMDYYEPDNDIYQWYIVSDNAADILTGAGECLYYHNTLDVYLWGIGHWGTAWDYVLTNIRCNTGK